MSDKRIKTDDPGDPRVSAAYREIADERTPEHLDHTILNAARGAARPRWNKAVAWLRPAAWVATIGVCLAIVIEISLLSDQGPAESDSILQESAPRPTASPAAEAKRLEKAQPLNIERQEFEQPQEAQRPAAAAREGRRDGTGASVDSAVPSIEKSENRARRQTIGDTKPAAAIPGAAQASDLVPETATERYCDETETGDPNAWLECILRLEREGLHEAARLERELLAAAFPPPELP